MPIRVDVLQELGGSPVAPHTNEAQVLTTLHESSPPTAVSALADDLPLDPSAVKGAVYRLSKKGLVTREDGEVALAGDEAELLAEGLVLPGESTPASTPGSDP